MSMSMRSVPKTFITYLPTSHRHLLLSHSSLSLSLSLSYTHRHNLSHNHTLSLSLFFCLFHLCFGLVLKQPQFQVYKFFPQSQFVIERERRAKAKMFFKVERCSFENGSTLIWFDRDSETQQRQKMKFRKDKRVQIKKLIQWQETLLLCRTCIPSSRVRRKKS